MVRLIDGQIQVDGEMDTQIEQNITEQNRTEQDRIEQKSNRAEEKRKKQRTSTDKDIERGGQVDRRGANVSTNGLTHICIYKQQNNPNPFIIHLTSTLRTAISKFPSSPYHTTDDMFSFLRDVYLV